MGYARDPRRLSSVPVPKRGAGLRPVNHLPVLRRPGYDVPGYIAGVPLGYDGGLGFSLNPLKAVKKAAKFVEKKVTRPIGKGVKHAAVQVVQHPLEAAALVTGAALAARAAAPLLSKAVKLPSLLHRGAVKNSPAVAGAGIVAKLAPHAGPKGPALVKSTLPVAGMALSVPVEPLPPAVTQSEISDLVNSTVREVATPHPDGGSVADQTGSLDVLQNVAGAAKAAANGASVRTADLYAAADAAKQQLASGGDTGGVAGFLRNVQGKIRGAEQTAQTLEKSATAAVQGYENAQAIAEGRPAPYPGDVGSGVGVNASGMADVLGNPLVLVGGAALVFLLLSRKGSAPSGRRR